MMLAPHRKGLPNGSRLSCGAPKKDSFHNLRAPAASSAVRPHAHRSVEHTPPVTGYSPKLMDGPGTVLSNAKPKRSVKRMAGSFGRPPVAASWSCPSGPKA